MKRVDAIYRAWVAMANMGAQVATQANGTKGENDVGENDVARAEVPNTSNTQVLIRRPGKELPPGTASSSLS